MDEIAVRFEHVSMAFPGVLANDDVTLDIKKGEVFALVGENGAGKSTLMNVLYGINTPTDGRVFINGWEMTDFDPKTAIAMGVGMVPPSPWRKTSSSAGSPGGGVCSSTTPPPSAGPGRWWRSTAWRWTRPSRWRS